MTSTQKASSWLIKKGYPVIPIKPNDKKPYVSWAEFQTRLPTEDEVRNWWSKWPDANVAIITGKMSGLIVVDVDTEEGNENINEFLPDSLATPMSRTPNGGWHYYFEYFPGLVNKARVIEGTDIRTDGGYIIVPPSINGNGNGYIWAEGLKISDLHPATMPDMLKSILLEGSDSAFRNEITHTNKIARSVPSNIAAATQGNTTQHDTTLSWEKGCRDDSLFHVANSLVRGGMAQGNIYNVLNILGKACSPPFDERELEVKIRSAFQRSETRDRNLHEEIRAWVLEQECNMTYQDCDKELHIATSRNMRNRTVIFGRLVEEGLIERDGKKRGCFKRVDPGVEWLDLDAATTEPLDIKLPFGIESIIHLPEKSVVCVAGEPGSGKTAFMLNCALMNIDHPWTKTYLTSEAGAQSLKTRLLKKDPPVSIKDVQSKIRFGAKMSDFHSAIDPTGLNFIDYIEVHDSFYLVDQYLTSLFDKLETGVVICGIQKNQNSALGLGGGFSMQKPEMYLIIEDNYPEGAIMSIRKGRWWVGGTSRVGLKMRYRTSGGINLHATQKEWSE